jgi:hypothetical protein
MKREHAETVLLQRWCVGCGIIFHICRYCDHGHRYCGESCRQRSRRRQRQAANRKHQQTDYGRADHRDRQREYRRRRREAAVPAAVRVTDQSSQPQIPFGRMTSSTPHPVRKPVWAYGTGLKPLVCIFCGRGERSDVVKGAR